MMKYISSTVFDFQQTNLAFATAEFRVESKEEAKKIIS